MNNIFINDKGMVNDIYSKLYEERIIFLTSDLTDGTANLIKSQLLYLNHLSNDPIKMYIDSPGGSIYTALGIIDIMNYIKSPVYTTNIGLCASMSAVILSNGEKGYRKSLKNARTMIHQPSGFFNNYVQSTDMEIKTEEIIKIKKNLYRILSDNTGKSVKNIEKDSERDFWMSSKEALEYGIIDEIL